MKLICDHCFYAVFIQQSSGSFFTWWLSYKDGMKLVVADKHHALYIYIYIYKLIYIFIYHYIVFWLSHRFWALSKLYCIWFATNQPIETVTIIYWYNIYREREKERERVRERERAREGSWKNIPIFVSVYFLFFQIISSTSSSPFILLRPMSIWKWRGRPLRSIIRLLVFPEPLPAAQMLPR